MWYYVIGILGVLLLCVVTEYVSLYWDEYTHKSKHHGTYQYWPKEVTREVHDSGRGVYQTTRTA